MAFPDKIVKKIPHKFLWFRWETEQVFNDNWWGLGETGELIKGDLVQTMKCMFCYSRLYVGKEDGLVFNYCPRCLLKVEKK
jgi:hypothetical protein